MPSVRMGTCLAARWSTVAFADMSVMFTARWGSQSSDEDSQEIRFGMESVELSGAEGTTGESTFVLSGSSFSVGSLVESPRCEPVGESSTTTGGDVGGDDSGDELFDSVYAWCRRVCASIRG